MSTQADAGSPPPHRHRAARTVVRWTIKAFLIVTIASLTFNALTTPPRTLAPPGGKDVVVAGIRVHFETWGTHGSPIVLVHGFVESTQAWSLTARHLAEHHRVYALDLAGYGYTQYSGHYSLDDEAALVTGFISALQIDKPTIIGHSLGAAVVGKVALTAPRKISGVIFADGDAMPFPGDSPRRGTVLSLVMRTPYATSLYRLGTRWSWPGSAIFADQCGSSCAGSSPAFIDAWMRPLRKRDAERALPKIAAAGVLHLTPDEVRRIRVPRGIIWGAEDATSGGSLAGAREHFRRDGREAPLVIVPQAGHLSMVADPEGFASGIETLLERM